MKHIRSLALLTVAGALLVAPSLGQAHHKATHTGGQGNGGGGGAAKCVVNKGFVVKGTLVSHTAGDAPSVTLTVTKLNRHARRSGVTDADTVVEGTQYTVDGGEDSFKSRLSGYEDGESPAAGDKVRVIGKVAVTKRKCEPNASVEDRYDAVNVRKVKIVDVD